MRVLIAVDDSPCSQTAVDEVAARTWATSTIFKILSAVEPITLKYVYAGAIHGVDALKEAEKDYVKARKKAVDQQVEQLVSKFGKDRVSGEVREDFAPELIINEAKNWNADLIICGSHGRKGMKRFLLGSVAEKIVCNAHCSVEVVKRVSSEKASKEEMAEDFE